MYVQTTITEYTVGVLPPDDLDGHTWSLVLTRAGDGRWSVQQKARRDFHLNASGQWDRDPGPDRPTDWTDTHRFDLETAQRLAEAAAPHLTLNDTTAAELAGKRQLNDTPAQTCLDLWRETTIELTAGPAERTLLLTATSSGDTSADPVAAMVLRTPPTVDAQAAADWLYAMLEPQLGDPTLSVTAVPVDDDAGTDWSRRGVAERYLGKPYPATLQDAATLSEKVLKQLTALTVVPEMCPVAARPIATDIRRLANCQAVLDEVTTNYEWYPDDGTMRAQAADGWIDLLYEAAQRLEAEGAVQPAIDAVRQLQSYAALGRVGECVRCCVSRS